MEHLVLNASLKNASQVFSFQNRLQNAFALMLQRLSKVWQKFEAKTGKVGQKVNNSESK